MDSCHACTEYCMNLQGNMISWQIKFHMTRKKFFSCAARIHKASTVKLKVCFFVFFGLLIKNIKTFQNESISFRRMRIKILILRFGQNIFLFSKQNLSISISFFLKKVYACLAKGGSLGFFISAKQTDFSRSLFNYL